MRTFQQAERIIEKLEQVSSPGISAIAQRGSVSESVVEATLQCFWERG